MYNYNNLVVEKKLNLLRLIILILSKKDEYVDIKKQKNTLISISDVENPRTEMCKLILYIFAHFCSKSPKKATIDEYLEFTNRQVKNCQKIRETIKSLSKLKICYYNNNFKKVSEPLFTKVFLKNKTINYEIGSFFKSKLKFQGTGHRSISFPSIIFQNLGLKNKIEEKAKFIVFTYLICHEFSLVDIKNKRKMNYISLLLQDYFGLDDDFIIKIINEVKQQYLYLI